MVQLTSFAAIAVGRRKSVGMSRRRRSWTIDRARDRTDFCPYKDCICRRRPLVKR